MAKDSYTIHIQDFYHYLLIALKPKIAEIFPLDVKKMIALNKIFSHEKMIPVNARYELYLTYLMNSIKIENHSSHDRYGIFHSRILE